MSGDEQQDRKDRDGGAALPRSEGGGAGGGDDDGLIFDAEGPQPLAPRAAVPDDGPQDSLQEPAAAAEDYPVPDVSVSLDEDVLLDEDVATPVRSLPRSIAEALRRQAEERGESQRTVLLRWLMVGHDYRPDLVPPVHPGQLVDLRTRTGAFRRVSTRYYLEQKRRGGSRGDNGDA